MDGTTCAWKQLAVCPVLAAVEVFHLVAHAVVLFRLQSIGGMTRDSRVRYFSLDLASSLAAYAFTGQFRVLVVIHAVIHLLAVRQLLCPFSVFFDAVFVMADRGFEKQPVRWVQGYVAGTILDMATHLANAYALLRIILS